MMLFFSPPAVGGRQQPKPMKLKRILKLKEQEVMSSACGAHATAMVSKDGKLFMFGSLEEELTDKSSGELVPFPVYSLQCLVPNPRDFIHICQCL